MGRTGICWADPVLKDQVKRMKQAGEKHGFDVNDAHDMIEQNNEFIEKSHNKLGTKRSGYEVKQIDLLNGDTAAFYTPLDSFYGTPQGGDLAHDLGRIPVGHLMALYNKNIGVVYHGCNRVAENTLRNRFEFVEIDDINKAIKKPFIKEVKRWMQVTKFWSVAKDWVELERASGNGFFIFHYPGEKAFARLDKPPPPSKPNRLEAFSAERIQPSGDYNTPDTLDYNKREWKLVGGGVRFDLDIHEDRNYVLETRRVEAHIRGLAITEPVWVPCMCYMNTMYYILRALAQLGIVQTTFVSAKEYPTTKELDAYIELGGKMRATKTFVVGAGGKAVIDNMAGKIGSGIETYLEFLREDISAAWQIPKNQLFGRSDGGGLDGAGAIVSKEDYLSMLTGLQMNLTDDIMDILINIAGFKELEGTTLRWSIDLFKTESQRLEEEMQRLQIELMTHQIDMAQIQSAQAGFELQMTMKHPEILLPNKTGGNGNTSKKDFSDKPFDLQKAIKGNQDFIDNIRKKRLKKLKKND